MPVGVEKDLNLNLNLNLNLLCGMSKCFSVAYAFLEYRSVAYPMLLLWNKCRCGITSFFLWNKLPFDYRVDVFCLVDTFLSDRVVSDSESYPCSCSIPQND